MRIRIYPYKQGSRSAQSLAEALGGKVLKIEGSTFQPRRDDVIINWGSSECVRDAHLNKPEAIRLAANKLSAFEAFSNGGVSTPKFASSRTDVSWEPMTVVRHKLTGHSGEGIEIVESGRELPNAPLYVQYIPKKDEYRVHIIGQSIIAVQRKARRLDVETPNWRVRNHDNGFNFVREGVEPPNQVLEEAQKAIAALGLDFGAVDIIFNEKHQRAYVLEVNCAPGLEGQTIADYARGIKEHLNGREV